MAAAPAAAQNCGRRRRPASSSLGAGTGADGQPAVAAQLAGRSTASAGAPTSSCRRRRVCCCLFPPPRGSCCLLLALCPSLLVVRPGEVQAAAGRQDRLPRAPAAVHPGQEQVQHPQVPVSLLNKQPQHKAAADACRLLLVCAGWRHPSAAVGMPANVHEPRAGATTALAAACLVACLAAGVNALLDGSWQPLEQPQAATWQQERGWRIERAIHPQRRCEQRGSFAPGWPGAGEI